MGVTREKQALVNSEKIDWRNSHQQTSAVFEKKYPLSPDKENFDDFFKFPGKKNAPQVMPRKKNVDKLKMRIFN